MTKEENLAKIRAACIAANPEITELKFGCKILTTKGERATFLSQGGSGKERWMTLLDEDGLISTDDDYFSGHVSEAIGRPITLADVLLAREKKVLDDLETQSVIPRPRKAIFGEIADRWNLRASLEEQSDETLEFITSIL